MPKISDPLPEGYPKLFVHQSEWTAFEAAGYDMRFFELIKPITIDHQMPSSAEMRAETRRRIDTGEPLGAFHNAAPLPPGTVVAGSLMKPDGYANNKWPPQRKHINSKQCGGKEAACLAGKSGHCVACADDD